MERKIPRLITLTNDADYPLSEEEIVEATIAFANGAEILLKDREGGPHRPKEIAERELARRRILEKEVSNLRRSAKDVLRSWKSGENTPLSDEAKAEWESLAQMTTIEQLANKFRKRARETISLSLNDPLEGAGSFWDGLLGDFPTMSLGREFLVDHRLDHSDKGIRLVIYYRFPTFFNLVVLGLALLLDDRRRFREKLCQCQWGPCGFLFFEVKPPTGRPQRKYCCSEHLLKAHDENAAKRMKRKRSAPRSKK